MYWEEYLIAGDGKIYPSGLEVFRHGMGIRAPGMEIRSCLVLEAIWNHCEM